jgi:tetratricopeptide (TPR) repeat protein
MNSDPNPRDVLPLMACLYRERRSGLVSLGATPALNALLRDGQVVALGPVAPPPAAPRPALPSPDDPVRLRLERVLEEIGIRPQPKAALPPPRVPAGDLRERLLQALVDPSLTGTFEEGRALLPDMAETAGSTEALILEAVGRLRNTEAVRKALDDIDRPLVATAAFAEERTLTLTEGYLLSRIDGVSSARQVLRLVPLDQQETERTLLGLLLTGRVEYRAAAPRDARHPEAAAPALVRDQPVPIAEPASDMQGPGTTPPDEAFPLLAPVEDEARPEAAGAAAPAAAPDPETVEQRKQILEVFRSLPLKNHFEVLGVAPGCSDAEVKRAYAALAKRYHPDAHRDPHLADLHDVLEAIFIRVGEAWEVLGDARSRASYEARSGVISRTQDGVPAPAAPAAPPAAVYVPPEETLYQARLLLSQARYWEAIQVLESAVPRMEPRRHQQKGRILLAKAYAKNPNWLRRAEEHLQEVVRQDPTNVEAHYELGRLYKRVGHAARAQAMFRRVVELRPEHREAAAELGFGESPSGSGLLRRLFGRGKAS